MWVVKVCAYVCVHVKLMRLPECVAVYVSVSPVDGGEWLK